MPIKLIVHVMGFAYFAISATADVNAMVVFRHN